MIEYTNEIPREETMNIYIVSYFLELDETGVGGDIVVIAPNYYNATELIRSYLYDVDDKDQPTFERMLEVVEQAQVYKLADDYPACVVSCP